MHRALREDCRLVACRPHCPSAPCDGEAGYFGGSRVLGCSQAPEYASLLLDPTFAGKPAAFASATPQRSRQ